MSQPAANLGSVVGTNTDSEKEPQEAAPSAHREIASTVSAITSGLIASLEQLNALDQKSASNLVVPGKALLFLGGGLLVAALALRTSPWTVRTFDFSEFVTLIIAACVLLLVGVLLFLYQYRTEQIKATAVVDTTEKVATGLVAVLGPGKR